MSGGTNDVTSNKKAKFIAETVAPLAKEVKASRIDLAFPVLSLLMIIGTIQWR